MKMLIRFILAVTVTMLALQPVYGAKLDDSAFTELAKNLQLELDRLRTEQGFPGATAAVVLESGRMVKLATGMADLERGIAMTPDHRMPGGSTGKTYAAAVAVVLEQEGKWDLDDKVSKYLGDKPWYGDLANKDEITLRQLARHRSGIENYYDIPRFHRLVEEKFAAGGDLGEFTRDELIYFVAGVAPLFEPGKGFRYTDIGYILLGEAIEAVTGEDYFDVLADRLLEPLGLNLTAPTAIRMSGIAQGYAPEPSPLVPGAARMVGEDGRFVIDPVLEFTGGGLVNNPGDMARWVQALYTGKAISKAAAEAILAPPAHPTTLEKESGNYYGLGVFVMEHPSGGKAYGHGGYFPGYRSEMLYLPEHGFSAAVQLNTEAGTWTKAPPVGSEKETGGKRVNRRSDARVVIERLQSVVIKALNSDVQ